MTPGVVIKAAVVAHHAVTGPVVRMVPAESYWNSSDRTGNATGAGAVPRCQLTKRVSFKTYTSISSSGSAVSLSTGLKSATTRRLSKGAPYGTIRGTLASVTGMFRGLD